MRRVLEQKGFDFGRPSFEWSADGQWLVSTSIGNFEKIVAVSRDGRERREAQGQSWSVVRLDDGSFVLHMRPGSLEDDLPEIQGRLDILTMSVGQLMQAAEDAAISLDGRSAAHLMKNSLTLVDLGSGQERRRLTKPGGYLAWAPAGDTPWSPDGKMLAFVDYESEAALSVLRVDGDTPPLKLAPDVSGAAWSPDSKRLAYVVTEYPAEEGALPESHIEVGQADGGGSKFRVDEAESPAWTPDGSALAFVR